VIEEKASLAPTITPVSAKKTKTPKPAPVEEEDDDSPAPPIKKSKKKAKSAPINEDVDMIDAPAPAPTSVSKMSKPKEDFSAIYLRKIAAEVADDLDKVREAQDFKANSVPMLIHALRQGESMFSVEEKRRVVGAAQ
jgi:ribosome assembly protein 3